MGSELTKSVLSLLDHNKRSTVNTYPQDYLPGRPARSLYSKHGFVSVRRENVLELPEDALREAVVNAVCRGAEV